MGHSINVLSLRVGKSFKWRYFFIASSLNNYYKDFNLTYKKVFKYLYYYFDSNTLIFYKFGLILNHILVNLTIRNLKVNIFVYDIFWIKFIKHFLFRILGYKRLSGQVFQRILAIKKKQQRKFFRKFSRRNSYKFKKFKKGGYVTLFHKILSRLEFSSVGKFLNNITNLQYSLSSKKYFLEKLNGIDKRFNIFNIININKNIIFSIRVLLRSRFTTDFYFTNKMWFPESKTYKIIDKVLKRKDDVRRNVIKEMSMYQYFFIRLKLRKFFFNFLFTSKSKFNFRFCWFLLYLVMKFLNPNLLNKDLFLRIFSQVSYILRGIDDSFFFKKFFRKYQFKGILINEYLHTFKFKKNFFPFVIIFLKSIYLLIKINKKIKFFRFKLSKISLKNISRNKYLFLKKYFKFCIKYLKVQYQALKKRIIVFRNKNRFFLKKYKQLLEVKQKMVVLLYKCFCHWVWLQIVWRKLKKWYLIIYSKFENFLNKKLENFLCGRFSVNLKLIPLQLKVIYSEVVVRFLKWKILRKFSFYELAHKFLNYDYTNDMAIKGIFLKGQGRFTRRQRSSLFKYTKGALNFRFFKGQISHSYISIITKFGMCGVRVWINYDIDYLNRNFLNNFFS